MYRVISSDVTFNKVQKWVITFKVCLQLTVIVLYLHEPVHICPGFLLWYNLFFFLTSSAVIGEIDEETDSALDLGNIRAEPLNSVVH